MRDFIVIRQKAFYEYLQNYNKNKSEKEKIKLDLKDLAIFDYIAQFCLSDNEKIKSNRIVVDGKEYTHIAYKKIIDDNPFLDIKAKNKSQVIGTRINKLIKLGVIDKIFSQEKGSKTYFRVSFLDDRGITEKLQGVSFKNDRGYQSEVIGGITQNLYNRNINIENNNREIKIENKDSFFNLYIGEKTFLSVIFTLKNLAKKYGLSAYKEREYLKAFKELLKKGYGESELISVIYARMHKATMEEVNTYKFLQTIVNPKYLVKSIDQLIDEKNILIDELMDTYEENIDVIDDEKIPYQVISVTYYEDYQEAREFIDNNGNFSDITGYEYHLKDLEYYLYLMNKFLSKYDIELFPNIRSLIILVVKNQLPFIEFMKRLLFGLIYLEDKNQLEQLKAFSNSNELATLYKNILSNLQIDKNFDEVVEELEQQLVIE